MSQLLAIVYPELHRAVEVLTGVRGLHKDPLSDLDSAVYVTRAHTGGIELHQNVQVPGTGVNGGDYWSLLIGLLFSVSLLGGVVGTAADTIGTDLAGLGIDGQFATDLDTAIGPGSSAIFAMLHDARLDDVLAAFRPHGGTALWTPVSRRAMTRLRAALNAERRP